MREKNEYAEYVMRAVAVLSMKIPHELIAMIAELCNPRTRLRLICVSAILYRTTTRRDLSLLQWEARMWKCYAHGAVHARGVLRAHCG